MRKAFNLKIKEWSQLGGSIDMGSEKDTRFPIKYNTETLSWKRPAQVSVYQSVKK
jgi:hypothetical protein